MGFYCCGWWAFTAGGLVFFLTAGGLVGTTADDGQGPGEEFPFEPKTYQIIAIGPTS